MPLSSPAIDGLQLEVWAGIRCVAVWLSLAGGQPAEGLVNHVGGLVLGHFVFGQLTQAEASAGGQMSGGRRVCPRRVVRDPMYSGCDGDKDRDANLRLHTHACTSIGFSSPHHP
jgi:hypothetical protein